MNYNLADKTEAGEALWYLLDLTKNGKMVKIAKISPKRSLNQNSYLHLLLGAYGLEKGHTLDEAKTIYKRYANPDIYIYQKGDMYFLRSSADLDVAQMTKSIDNFRSFAKEQGIYLPPAENQDELRSIENAMEKSNFYLRG